MATAPILPVAGSVGWAGTLNSAVALVANAVDAETARAIAAEAAVALVDVSISAATTLTSASIGKMYVCTVTTTGYTLTLPTPVGNTSAQIGVRIVSTANQLLTLATSAGNIDGLATRIMWAGESAILESDGTNWIKISGKTRPMNCYYQSATSISVVTSTLTLLPLDSVGRDNTGLMAAVAGRISINRSGLYSVKARSGLNNAPANSIRCITIAYKNGTTGAVQQENNAVIGQFYASTSSDDVALVVTDYLQLQFYHVAGANWATIGGTAAGASALTVTEIPDW